MLVVVGRSSASQKNAHVLFVLCDGDSLCSSERFQGRRWPTCLPASFTMMVATPVAAPEVCPTKSEVG